MADAFGTVWLKQQLAKALSWDEAVVEGVVAALASANTQDEVEDIVAVSHVE